MMQITAIIPVKHFSHAKQRLADLLTATERHHLASAMLDDALTLVKAAPVIADIAIVSSDLDVARVAERHGLRNLSDRATGLNEAVDLAAHQLLHEHVERIVVLPTDIPLAKADDLGALVASHLDFDDNITIAMAQKDFGTNCMVMSPPASMPVCFGSLSGLRHVENAKKCGLKAHAMCVPGFALDIDESEDVAQYMKRASAGATWKCLMEIKVLERIAERKSAGSFK